MPWWLSSGGSGQAMGVTTISPTRRRDCTATAISLPGYPRLGDVFHTWRSSVWRPPRSFGPGLRLIVVGLGPGPAEWVGAAAVSALRPPAGHVFARTRFHPALDALGVDCETFDDLYDAAASLPEVEKTMA